MPVPIIIAPIVAGVAAVAAGAAGIVKGVKAVSDNNKADDINKDAKGRVDKAKTDLESSREQTKRALEYLGQKKAKVLDDHMGRFVDLYGRLKEVSFTDSIGLHELRNLKLDRQGFVELKQMHDMFVPMAQGVLSGSIAGGAMAFGAYGAATTLATASTGTAIASLSGAAATNATLAFFGGGALAAGGLGVAGGMAILGGIVAGPALAVLGCVMGSKASENLDNAYSNLAKAKQIAEELKTLWSASEAIRERTAMFTDVLAKLDRLFEPQIYSLETIIEKEGCRYPNFKGTSKAIVGASASTALAIKKLLDTPILSESGALTAESERVCGQAANAYGKLKEAEKHGYVAFAPAVKPSFPQAEID